MLTTGKPKLSERDIAAAVVRHLEAQGLKVRQEVVVTLPDHGQVTADIVALRADETGDWFTVVECKRALDNQVKAQAERWRGYANRVYVAYRNAGRVTHWHRKRTSALESLGIGRFILCGEAGLNWADSSFADRADTRLLSAAFHAHDGSHDLPAGSASGHRMNADRALLADIARVLGDEAWEFVPIRREFRQVKSPQMLRTLIRDNPGILDHSADQRTKFFRAKQGGGAK